VAARPAAGAELGFAMTLRAEREQFGSRVLGPILAEFSLRLLMTARALPADSQILFCARGGLRLHVFFRRFLRRIGEPAPLPLDDLMISRLAAARGALLKRAPAALDEIGREFEGATNASALAALAQTPVEASASTGEQFEIQSFLRLLESTAPAAVEARWLIAAQAALFDDHFQAKRSRTHVVLCDTGLYGSTLRLMMANYPGVPLHCVMLARANYKGFDESHFARTLGLIVERNSYSALDRRSAVLRYWQFIEDVCEPPLDSVKVFARDPSGTPRSNLERDGWGDLVTADARGFFTGALEYLSQLSPDGYGERLARDASDAWREFKRRIVWPTAADRKLLAVNGRGRDFGRDEEMDAFAPEAAPSWSALRASLWREGAAAALPAGLGGVLQVGLEAAQIAKQARRGLAPLLRIAGARR